MSGEVAVMAARRAPDNAPKQRVARRVAGHGKDDSTPGAITFEPYTAGKRLAGYRLYCDAGLAGDSPSTLGAAYAWCLVKGMKVLAEGQGDLYLRDLFPNATEECLADLSISSNAAELYAICQAVTALSGIRDMHGKEYKLCTDSLNALGWYSNYPMPGDYCEMLYTLCGTVRGAELTQHLSRIPVLIKGHPSAEDLARGYMIEDGKRKRVDFYNRRCDLICKKRCRAIVRAATAKAPVTLADLLPAKAPAVVSPLALASARATQPGFSFDFAEVLA